MKEMLKSISLKKKILYISLTLAAITMLTLGIIAGGGYFDSISKNSDATGYTMSFKIYTEYASSFGSFYESGTGGSLNFSYYTPSNSSQSRTISSSTSLYFDIGYGYDLSAVPNSGYMFNRNKSVNITSQRQPSTFYTSFTAYFSNKLTITLDRAGGTGGSETAETYYNGALPSISVPTRSGYIFDGYYTGSSGGGTKYYNSSGSSVISTYTYAGNLRLYANWKSAPVVTITLNRNGGSGGDSQLTGYKGDPLPSYVTIPTRSHYTFNGYYYKSGSTSTVYYDNSGRLVTSRVFDTNITLDATWMLETIRITLDNQGGTGQASISGSYNSIIPSSVEVPTMPNFRFLGYYTYQNGGGSQYYDEAGMRVGSYYFSNEMTLYAAWLELWTNQASGKDFANSGHAGTKSDPYQITSAEDLAQLAKDVNGGNSYSNKYFEQTSNIDLSGVEWEPIGIADNIVFEGNYDGHNFTISNLTISVSCDRAGLFGVVSGGEVHNFVLNYIDINKGGDAGGAAGDLLNGGSIYNVTCQGSITEANISGGIVGYVENGSVASCISYCSVSPYGWSAGGIVGAAEDNSLIANNIFEGILIVDYGEIGGIVGICNQSILLFNYVRCSVDRSFNYDYEYIPPFISAGSDNVVIACYAIIDSQKYISTAADDSSWTEGWGIVSSINDGFPIQKELFWPAEVANSTSEDFQRVFDGFELVSV